MLKRIPLMLVSAMALVSCGGDGASTIDSNANQPATQPQPEAPVGEVRVITTTASRSSDLQESTLPFSRKSGMETATTIKLIPSETYQTMDGFGVAITGSTCYNLMRMTEENRHLFLNETFSDSEGYGFSYCRVSIGCSDFSLSEYTCCDQKGIENFALNEEETQYVIPILKEI